MTTTDRNRVRKGRSCVATQAGPERLLTDDGRADRAKISYRSLTHPVLRMDTWFVFGWALDSPESGERTDPESGRSEYESPASGRRQGA